MGFCVSAFGGVWGGGGVNRGLRHSGRLATSTVRPKPNPIHLQLRILGFRIYGFS